MSRRTRSSRGASPQPHHPQLQFQFQRTDDHEQHLVASGPQTLTPEEEELLSSNPRELTPEKRKLRRRIQNRIAAQNSRKNKKEVVEQMHDHRDTALVLRAYCRVLVRQIRSMGAKPVPIRSTAMQDEIDRVCRSTYEPGLNSDALMMRLADEAVDIYNDEEDLDDESSQYSQGSSESEQHLEHSEISSGEESAPESLSPTLRGVQLVGGDMSPTSPPVELSDQRSHLATRSRQPSLKGSFSPVLAPITAYSQQQQQLQLQPQSQPQQSFKPVQFNALAPIYSTVPAFSAIEPLSLQVASQPGMQASSWPQQSAGNYVTLGGGYHFLAGNQLNTPSVSQQCGSEITCADESNRNIHDHRRECSGVPSGSPLPGYECYHQQHVSSSLAEAEEFDAPHHGSVYEPYQPAQLSPSTLESQRSLTSGTEMIINFDLAQPMFPSSLSDSSDHMSGATLALQTLCPSSSLVSPLTGSFN